MVQEEQEAKKTEPEDKVSILENKLSQLEQRLNNQDKVISRKEEENKRLRDELLTRNDSADLSKAAFAILASRTGQSEEDVETLVRDNQPNLVKQFEQIVTNERKRREQETQAKEAATLEKRVTALGYGRGSSEHYEIFGRLAMGDSEGAYTRLDELEKQKTAKETPKVEAKKEPEIDLEAIRQEERRKVLEEQGRLVSETGIPGGRPGVKTISMSDLHGNPKLYKELFPNGESDFRKALDEGRITT